MKVCSLQETSSGQLQALRNELFSVNCGNEAIAIKALKTDLIKIIVSLTWVLVTAWGACKALWARGRRWAPRPVCSEVCARAAGLRCLTLVEEPSRLRRVVSTVTCHVCWFSEHSVPETLVWSSLKPNTLRGNTCLSGSFCTFLVTGHWTLWNHSTCWDHLGRDDVFPTAWL